MKKGLIILLFVFGLAPLHAQWVQATMAEYLAIVTQSDFFKERENSFSFECEYLFFESLDGTKEKLKYSSYFQKTANKSFYFEQFGRIIVQNATHKILIDTTENVLVLSDADSIFQDASYFDVSNYTGQTDKIKKSQDAKHIKFYFELPKGQKYMAFEIWYDLQNNLQKIIMYASQQIDNGEDQGILIRPRMEINYKNFNYKTNNKLKLNLEDIIVFENDKVIVNEKYRSLELIDLRKKLLEE